MGIYKSIPKNIAYLPWRGNNAIIFFSSLEWEWRVISTCHGGIKQATGRRKKKKKRWRESEKSIHHMRSTGLSGSFQTDSQLESMITVEKEEEGEERRPRQDRRRQELEEKWLCYSPIAMTLMIVLSGKPNGPANYLRTDYIKIPFL